MAEKWRDGETERQKKEENERERALFLAPRANSRLGPLTVILCICRARRRADGLVLHKAGLVGWSAQRYVADLVKTTPSACIQQQQIFYCE